MLVVQARKKSTKINFWGPETARWGGGLPRRRVVVEKFVPSLESFVFLGYGIAGMSRTPREFKKFVPKKFVRILRSPVWLVWGVFVMPLLQSYRHDFTASHHVTTGFKNKV